VIDASPDDVWAALRDWGALRERLTPGFVTDVQLEGDDRIVTFFDGSVVRETLVDLDDDDVGDPDKASPTIPVREHLRGSVVMAVGPLDHRPGQAAGSPTNSPCVRPSSWNRERA
jgi:Polyketide cyclase / dehydrase and lipid transport